jgi:hypothetical protein
MLNLHLQQINALDAAITEIDREVDANLAPFRTGVELLTSIPGISTLSAQVILSEIGTDMSRFPTAGHLISWAGLCPGNDESAGNRPERPSSIVRPQGEYRLNEIAEAPPSRRERVGLIAQRASRTRIRREKVNEGQRVGLLTELAESARASRARKGNEKGKFGALSVLQIFRSVVNARSSGAAGSHRRALPEPDVNLSAHPAPSVRPFRI